ncbi:hypothetical protein SBA4_210017 [Candidatus Sulfopaludibacter sp. SbA4]|nr:hypothetical protein SBA4_210017 [Candidatus Sulfopaludibacter sp. SbA4]
MRRFSLSGWGRRLLNSYARAILASGS